MKPRLVLTLAVLAALSLLSVVGLEAAVPPGWSVEGCWSPYPNCVGAKDVYRDSSGQLWQCKACGTTTNPSPTTCYKSGNLHAIGYWCS